jgi:GntR family transcriptional repressor for pyruvate dehydrogenase complex
LAEEIKEYHKVVTYIKALLQEEKISIGDKLPTERDISKELSISRNSIREALRVLENMGIVESRQGSGNYLIGDVTKRMVDSLHMMLVIKSISQLEISQFRRYMELAAFHIVIDDNIQFDATTLARILDQMEHASIEDQVNLDKEFHNHIIGASTNHLMISMMNACSEILETSVGEVLCRIERDEEKKKKLRKVHRRLYESIANRNKELGIQAIHEHYDMIDDILEIKYETR